MRAITHAKKAGQNGEWERTAHNALFKTNMKIMWVGCGVVGWLVGWGIRIHCHQGARTSLHCGCICVSMHRCVCVCECEVPWRVLAMAKMDLHVNLFSPYSRKFFARFCTFSRFLS